MIRYFTPLILGGIVFNAYGQGVIAHVLAAVVTVIGLVLVDQANDGKRSAP